ncbi:hypothetical protein [Streptomyces sp. NPDC058758]|uniref:hypothetical protein n=1 Tax=Streptomyces sp. NPDC058758 TaxID=3346627 RepID=UPI00369B10DD
MAAAQAFAEARRGGAERGPVAEAPQSEQHEGGEVEGDQGRGRFLAATIVNVSGDGGPDDRGPAITPTEVGEFLTDTGLDALVMGGSICPAAHHLTIVDCTSPDTRLVRTGLVHPRAINAAIG